MADDPLEAAIIVFRNLASDQFNTAYGQIKELNAKPPPSADDQVARNSRAADLAKAQGQLTAALQQLVQADTMESDRLGRRGYKAIVSLMTDTQSTAAAVYHQLTDLLKSGSAITPEDRELVLVLINLLRELGPLSPIAIWQKASTGAA